jgi:hypothetical protein
MNKTFCQCLVRFGAEIYSSRASPGPGFHSPKTKCEAFRAKIEAATGTLCRLRCQATRWRNQGVPGAGFELIGGDEAIARVETAGNRAKDDGTLLLLAAFANMDVTVDADLNMMRCVWL